MPPRSRARCARRMPSPTPISSLRSRATTSSTTALQAELDNHVFNAPDETAAASHRRCQGPAERDPGAASDRSAGDRSGAAAAARSPDESRWAWLFLAPTLVGLAVLSAGPIIAALGISLTTWDLLTPPTFVGLDNFATLLPDDPRSWTALRNTSFYTLTSVPLGHRAWAGDRARAQPAASGASPGSAPRTSCRWSPRRWRSRLVWSWIYSPDRGPLNAVLRLGRHPAQRWITDPFWAMPAIVVMSVWQGLGITVIIFLAGLQAHPRGVLRRRRRRRRRAGARLPPRSPCRCSRRASSSRGSWPSSTASRCSTRSTSWPARAGPPTRRSRSCTCIYENGFQNFKMGYAGGRSLGPVPHRGGAHDRLLPAPEPMGALPVSAHPAPTAAHAYATPAIASLPPTEARRARAPRRRLRRGHGPR